MISVAAACKNVLKSNLHALTVRRLQKVPHRINRRVRCRNIAILAITEIRLISHQTHFGIHSPDRNLHRLEDKLIFDIVLTGFIKFEQLLFELHSNPTLTEDAIYKQDNQQDTHPPIDGDEVLVFRVGV